MKLTQANLPKIKLPAGKSEHLEWDDSLAGFGLRIREGGSRKWVVQYKIGKKQRRMTIGSVNLLTPDQARNGWIDATGKKHDGAVQTLAKAKTGHDPAHDKAVARSTAGDTFEAKIAAFLDAQRGRVEGHGKRLRQSTYDAQEHWLTDRCGSLHGLPLGKINRATVSACLKGIKDEYGPTAADRAGAALSAMFAWAIRDGWEGGNPVIGTNKFSDNSEPKGRALSEAEVAAIWNNAPDSDFGRCIRLLMLTGCRRDEIGDLRWSELKELDDASKARIEIPGKRTKNGMPHNVPLSAAAVAILQDVPRRSERDLVFGEGEGGFSGWSKAKAALDAKLGSAVEHWRPHDLRHTADTRMHDCGVLPHVVEAVLNHISGHKGGVAGVYNHATYEAEKRAALDTLASYIKTALAKAAGGNVTRLKRA